MNKSILVLACLASTALVAGCSKPLPLTDEGKKVKVITADAAKECKFLGIIVDNRTTDQGGHDAAYASGINRAAAAGADSVVDDSKHGSDVMYNQRSNLVTLKIYKCGK